MPIRVHRSGLEEVQGEAEEVVAYEAGDELAAGVRVLPFGRICTDDAGLRIALLFAHADPVVGGGKGMRSKFVESRR